LKHFHRLKLNIPPITDFRASFPHQPSSLLPPSAAIIPPTLFSRHPSYPHQPSSAAYPNLRASFCGSYWGSTAQLLASNGYRVIIPDQIGFGKSSKPDHLQYSFQLLAQNTLAVLDSAHTEKVIVIGHSMGGMLATRFTLMFPEKVERLILEDPIGLEDWKIKVPYQSVDAWYHSATIPPSATRHRKRSPAAG